MPFTKHIIEPKNISQCPLPPGEPNELECLSNLTLANVIRQLSTLGQNASRIFDELTSDALKINARSQHISQRIEALSAKCAQLDIQSEEVSLADFQTKKQFRSSVRIDQQVVSRKTMPDAMRLMYNLADPPPALDKLNAYRTDGKDCMKFYTDPEFFFNIWCNELIKDNETRKIEKKRRKTRNVPATTAAAAVTGIDKQANKQPSSQLQQQQQQQHYQIEQQQHAMFINQAKKQQQNQQNQPHAALNAKNFNLPPSSDAFYPSEFGVDEHSMLPPPPSALQLLQHQQQQQQQQQQQHNYQLYVESTVSNNANGTRTNKITVQQQQAAEALLVGSSNGSSGVTNRSSSSITERPVLPPPPIPDHGQLSDLQQMQQQLIRKYDKTVANGAAAAAATGLGLSQDADDLPLPPSPPSLSENTLPSTQFKQNHQQQLQQTHNGLVALTMTQMSNMSLTTTVTAANNGNGGVGVDDPMFDMPLPPPPLELQDAIDFGAMLCSNTSNRLGGGAQNSNNNGNMLPPLPLPPPLPPLVESDSSSSTSSLSAAVNGVNATNISDNNTASSQTQANSSGNAVKTASSSGNYLDDINKRRYNLKPTSAAGVSSGKENLDESSASRQQKTASSVGEDGNVNIQPFVNNSDVAAIIDFIRKFRPHVRDSSDDEEENSDWDD